MSAATLLDAARRKGLRIATAESCTGGMLAASLTEAAGASDVFDRGAVTYSNIAKQQMLGVSAQTLADHGAVSEQTAAEMAAGLIARSNADIAVSITGIAGPGGSDHKPEGRVCFGIAAAAGTHTQTCEFGALGRDRVRIAAMKHAMTLLRQAIEAA